MDRHIALLLVKVAVYFRRLDAFAPQDACQVAHPKL